LAAKYAGYFPIGVAVTPAILSGEQAIVDANFNHLTAENDMKAGLIHPAEATWNWTNADALADYARSHGIKMTGHTLLWHRQTAAWMFQGLTPGDSASIETLKSRLKAHIEGMVERYGDVVDNWDVVNEATNDDTTKTYRTDSDWYKYFGSEEYIYWAFKYTKDALEAQAPGSSVGKLYYNDYNLTLKINSVMTMVDWLKTQGITIDGIGEQAHWRIDWPSATDVQTLIDKVVGAGLKFKISEVDLTLYNDYPPPDYQQVLAPEVPFTQELETQQANAYAQLFSVLRANAANITSVTFWGISDDHTWLDMTSPVVRNDYPLLWDDAHQPKDALAAIMNF